MKETLGKRFIKSIKLITNNPRKIERLVALRIDVQGTVPMVVPQPNKYNRKYLQTKKDRMIHSNFADLLSMENADISNPDSQMNIYAVVNRAMNGMMRTHKRPVQESVAAAVTAALSESPNISLNDDTESSELLGVSAAADGYCIGCQSVEDAIAAVARGEIVVVVDDIDRENEGDFIMAADLATPEAIATIIRYSSGIICVGMDYGPTGASSHVGE